MSGRAADGVGGAGRTGAWSGRMPGRGNGTGRPGSAAERTRLSFPFWRVSFTHLHRNSPGPVEVDSGAAGENPAGGRCPPASGVVGGGGGALVVATAASVVRWLVS